MVLGGYYVVRYLMERKMKDEVGEKMDDIEEMIISGRMKLREWGMGVKGKWGF